MGAVSAGYTAERDGLRAGRPTGRWVWGICDIRGLLAGKGPLHIWHLLVVLAP